MPVRHERVRDNRNQHAVGYRIWFHMFIPSQWRIKSQLEKEDWHKNCVLFHFLMGCLNPLNALNHGSCC